MKKQVFYCTIREYMALHFWDLDPKNIEPYYQRRLK